MTILYVSNRLLTKVLCVELGTVNFCFQSIVERGLVKMQNLSESTSNLRYAYLFSSAGVAEKSKFTAKFLRCIATEYETPQAEIDSLKSELDSDGFSARRQQSQRTCCSQVERATLAVTLQSCYQSWVIALSCMTICRIVAIP